MSIEAEINRIQAGRNAIRAKLVELGMAQSTDHLDQLAAAVGGIENQGAVSVTVQEGDTYAIPKGYHNGSGTVSGVAGGGNYHLQSKTATPTKTQQNITPDGGYYGLSDVTVAAIPEMYQDVTAVTAEAAHVLTGRIFVDKNGQAKTGLMPNNGAVEKVLSFVPNTARAASDIPEVYTIPKGCHDGTGTVTFHAEVKHVTPAKNPQTVVHSEGKVLERVTVDPIPDQYIDTATETGAAAADVLAGKTVYVNGMEITGAMPNNGQITAGLDGLANTSVEIPAGYTSGATVTLTGSIETALAAI